jgi:3D (Asp-Asp-Asp) domain-containing protein
MKKYNNVLLTLVVTLCISLHNVPLTTPAQPLKISKDVEQVCDEINKKRLESLDKLLNGDGIGKKHVKALNAKKVAIKEAKAKKKMIKEATHKKVIIKKNTQVEIKREIKRVAPKEEISRGNTRHQSQSAEGGWFNVEISFYTNSENNCSSTAAITASGAHANSETIATPSNIPFGTSIYIEGLGNKIVQDRGGAIKNEGNGVMKIDVYVPNASERELLNMGIVRTRARII